MRHPILILMGSLCWAGSVQAADEHAKGRWGTLLTWTNLPKTGGGTDHVQGRHMVVLRTGLVMVIDPEPGDEPNAYTLFDPFAACDTGAGDVGCENGTLGKPGTVYYGLAEGGIPTDAYQNVHCSGHVALPDGRVLFQGGGDVINDGKRSSIYTPYDPSNPDPLLQCTTPAGCWQIGPNTNGNRWYPTLTILGNGKVLATAGLEPVGGCLQGYNIPEVFDPLTFRWDSLEGASYGDGSCAPENQLHSFDIQDYPLMYVLTSGKVLYAGDVWRGNSMIEKTLDVNAQTWDDLDELGTSMYKPTTGAMYGADRIIKATGNGTTVRIRMSTSSGPTRDIIDSLNQSHGPTYMITLPDGKVLGVGGGWKRCGGAGASCTDDSQCNSGGNTPPCTRYIATKPELIDPDATTPQWVEMNPMDSDGREYHSSAVLMPDGRVLVAGGDARTDLGRSAQVYSPPYLFDSNDNPATRPVIDAVYPVGKSSADPINYGDQFVIELDGTAPSNTKISLIRPGGSTHGIDFEQRLLPLTDFSGTGTDTLTVSAPFDPYEAPPGYYMLFVLVNGVPSVAKFIRLAVLDSTELAKNRYITVTPNYTSGSRAIRVRLVDLENPNPPYEGNPPPDFSAFEGIFRYVGNPGTYNESTTSETTFIAAALQCTPVYRTDWNSFSAIEVYGAEVLSSSRYEIQDIPDPADSGTLPKPGLLQTVRTARWGDVVIPFQAPSPANETQPDLGDVGQIVDKFRSVPTALSKSETQLQSNVPRPDEDINFVDISLTVDAFRGVRYPYSGPIACP